MINSVTLIGYLGRDPELKRFDGGNQVCNLAVATTRKWSDRHTKKTKEETEWHNVSVWGKLAGTCSEYLSKGRQVYITGRLKYEKYEKDGQTKYITKIIAENIKFLGGGNNKTSPAKQQSEGTITQNYNKQPMKQKVGYSDEGYPGDQGDEIPF